MREFDLKTEFSIATLKNDLKERGWLFGVVAGWCAVFGGLCLLAAMLVFLKAIFDHSSPTQAALGLTIAGSVILIATAMMWKLIPIGRNVAVVSVACMSWVVGGYIARKTNNSFTPQVMTIVFSAMAMSCFTSSSVRTLFANASFKNNDEGVDHE